MAALVHAALAEYLSFIVLLFSLYVVAGGILITGSLRATPWSNAGILAFGTGIASIVGTTGAAMILIRPLIRANAARAHNAHVIIFFIFLVANIGGALTPLGDPPLFVGFLRGVDFFWPAQHLWLPTRWLRSGARAFVLSIRFSKDRWSIETPPTNPPARPVNLVLSLIIGAIRNRPGNRASFDLTAPGRAEPHATVLVIALLAQAHARGTSK
jgi:Na+/H+ antiporter NhaD/arsenite permease-like protein